MWYGLDFTTKNSEFLGPIMLLAFATVEQRICVPHVNTEKNACLYLWNVCYCECQWMSLWNAVNGLA